MSSELRGDRASGIQKNVILFIVLTIIVGASFWLWYLRIASDLESDKVITVTSETGVYDLRDFDFENAVAALSVHEEFISGELLTPEEFRLREDEAKVKEPYNSPVTTSRMTYLMPDDGRYILTDRSLDFCERIYVNGELVQEVGTVALTAEESKPHHAYLTIEVRPQNGVLEIVRQGNNFVHVGSNIAASLTLGSAELMHQYIAFDYGLAGFVVALFFTLTATHMLLYTVLRKYTSHLYFAVLSFVWGFRMGVTGIVLFGEWSPTFPWDLGFRIQQFTWPMGSALIFLIALHVLPKTLPSWVIKFYALFCTAYAASCFFLPTLPLSYTMFLFQVVNVIAMISLGLAAIFRLIRMAYARTARLEHYLFVAGLLPLVFAILNDTLYDHARSLFDSRFEMGDLGMFLFVVIQTAALFHDTGRKTEALYFAEQESRAEAKTLRRAGEMKEEFMRTLSHELQIPIATVSGAAQLTSTILKEDQTLDRDALLEQLRVIDNSAVRVSRMVSQLLDASAMETGSFKLFREQVNIHDLIHKVADLYFPIMNDAHITLTLHIDEDIPNIHADEERLLQTLLNLISNAIKHSHGNQITLAASPDQDHPGFVKITVRDNGDGIHPDLLADAFSRYPKHRSEKGNGLGLYIVAQTIQAHGGTVKIESELNQGTSIISTVPIWEE